MNPSTPNLCECITSFGKRRVNRKKLPANCPVCERPLLHKPSGFAVLDAEQQKKVASEGGFSCHEKGVAHRFTSAEARAAARKAWDGRAKKGA